MALPARLQCETPRPPAELPVLLASPECSCCYQSETKSKVTAWEMSFQHYPFGRTKQTTPNILALNVWHLTRGRGWPVSSWAADVLSPDHCTCPLGASASLSGVKTLPLNSPPSADEIAACIFAQDGLQRPRYRSGINEAGVQRRANETLLGI